MIFAGMVIGLVLLALGVEVGVNAGFAPVFGIPEITFWQALSMEIGVLSAARILGFVWAQISTATHLPGKLNA